MLVLLTFLFRHVVTEKLYWKMLIEKPIMKNVIWFFLILPFLQYRPISFLYFQYLCFSKYRKSVVNISLLFLELTPYTLVSATAADSKNILLNKCTVNILQMKRNKKNHCLIPHLTCCEVVLPLKWYFTVVKRVSRHVFRSS